MTKFHGPVKQWFITLPQSGNMERSTFVELFPPCKFAIIAQESHADGGVHLHAGIVLKKGISKAKLRNWCEKKFPDSHKRLDYSPVRSMKHAIDYCNKEDAEVLSVGELGTRAKVVKGVKEQDELDEEEARRYCEYLDSL